MFPCGAGGLAEDGAAAVGVVGAGPPGEAEV